MGKFVLTSIFCILLLGTLCFAQETEEEFPPPSWNYSPAQEEIIRKFGNPDHFTIILDQYGKFRYETWTYAGNVDKVFGFVNGDKTYETKVTVPLSSSAKVVGITPKQFTFKTTANNAKQMFGAPTRTLDEGKSKVLVWVRKGLNVTFTNNKIVTAGTVPPVK